MHALARHPGRRAARRLACAISVSVALLACASPPKRMYDGPAKPPEEVAVLTTELRVRVLQVDDYKIDLRRERPDAFELSPGQHFVKFRVTYRVEELAGSCGDGVATCTTNVKFVAEPGTEYRIAKVSRSTGATQAYNFNCAQAGYQHEFGAVLEDVTNGEIIPDAVAPLSC